MAFSESNVMDIVSNIEDYQKLIEELERCNPGYFDKNADNLVNKDIDSKLYGCIESWGKSYPH